MKIRIEFKPQDLWIGAYWENRLARREDILHGYADAFHLWICLLPMLPIHIEVPR